MLGRPVMVVPIRKSLLGNNNNNNFEQHKTHHRLTLHHTSPIHLTTLTIRCQWRVTLRHHIHHQKVADWLPMRHQVEQCCWSQIKCWYIIVNDNNDDITTRVSLGNLADFSTTSCVGDLSFLVKNRHTADCMCVFCLMVICFFILFLFGWICFRFFVFFVIFFFCWS